MKYCAEFTDTLFGEAHCSWVKWAIFDAPADASNALLVRRAKRAIGLIGRHKTHCLEDTLLIHPAGTSTILFVYPEE